MLVVVTRLADGEGGFGWTVPILLLALLAGLALLIVPRLGRAVLAAERHTLPEKALFLLAILLLLSVVADQIGTEDILGAFLAGVCLNRSLHQREELKDHLEFAGRMLFVPFFFVDTGMRLSLDALQTPRTWLLALALLAAILLTKSAAALLSGRFFGYGRTEIIAVASLSFPQAAAALAVVFLGLQLDLIDDQTADAVIIVIFLTCLIGPVLTRQSAARLHREKPS